MKGVVFTEFMEMVEATFGWEVMDDVIDAVELPSGGIYTAVGTYDHTEMVTLVVELSKQTGTPVPELLKAYGRYLFGRFAIGYGVFFENVSDAFTFLASLDSYIHVEVRKLYPAAELPRFLCESPAPDTLVMEYSSERPFADFAQGLLEGCIKHFDEKIDMTRDDISPTGNHTRFTLTRVLEPAV